MSHPADPSRHRAPIGQPDARIPPSPSQVRRWGRYGHAMHAAPCVVCVPAKLEAKRLPAMLAAMAVAFRSLEPMRGALVVALDGNGDSSEAILQAARADFPVDIHIVNLPPHDVPHAGRVRRAAMERGARLFPLEHTILLTTDADTQVDRDWISATRALMQTRDFVCGDIWRDDENGRIMRAPHEHYYHDLHRVRRSLDPVAFDADDPHPQNFGASLAIRRDAYVTIGGCPDVPSNEDVILTRRARQYGFRVVQDRSVRVLTSSRRKGRAKGGLAEALVREDADARAGKPFLIVDPRRYLAFYRESAELRFGFARNEDARVERAVERLGLDRLNVEEAWNRARTADAFVATVLDEPDFTADITLERARSILSREIAAPRRMVGA